MKKEMQCFLDGARGQYIPRDFARSVKRECLSGVEPEDLDYLARGPGGCLDDDQTLADGESVRGEWYWDVWDTVCDNAVLTDPETGFRFRLHQDDSLFLVPEDWECDDRGNWFDPDEKLSGCFDGNRGLEIEMTRKQALSALRQSRCDDDIAVLAQKPEIAAQLDAMDPDDIRAGLKEYGAWYGEELADDAQNRLRAVWLAAGDISENLNK